MSVYSVKGKGWRYDFTLKGHRYTEAVVQHQTTSKGGRGKKTGGIEEPAASRRRIGDAASRHGL